MDVIGIDSATQLEILQLVAAVMHIGNISFTESKNYAQVADKHCKLFLPSIYFAFLTASCAVAYNLYF